MRLFITLFILLSSLTLFSQSVEFKANAPTVVEMGEQFKISYSLNQAGNNLKVPTFEGFDLLMGPSTSTSSSFSSINGNVTRSVSYTYTYVLEGVKVGTYKIPAASVSVDGKTYTSNTLTIEVVASSAQGKAKQQGSQNGGQAVRTTAINEETIFVDVDVNRRSLYIGESLVATIKVYTKVDLVNFGQSKFPSFSGFLTEEVPTSQRIELVRQNYKGAIYNVGIIRKMLLFPQHTGEIVIEPFELECIIRQQLSKSRSFFDDFFGNYQDVKIKRESKPVKITVNELPHAGKPLGYSGAVGRIAMKTSISTDTLKANEAITYKVTFSGNGNMKLLEAPLIQFPPDFETYEPKVSKNVKTDENGMNGTVTYEYLIIPRYSGDYTIPAFDFSYFDTQSRAYKTLHGKEYKVHILKGEGREQQEGTTMASVQSFKKEDVRFLGEDIRYIKTGHLDLHFRGIPFYQTLAYWLSFLIPFVLFVAGILINRQRIKANADLVRVKNKAANKMAGKRMKVALTAMKNKNTEAFYDEVLKALWGYVSYKLNIDRSELNRDNISDILAKKSVEKELVDSFIAILDDCEFARYAPGGNTEQKMDEMYNKSVTVITKLDKVIR
ncbi:BatD family protein [Odoribacter sp. OttesenSCG-928-J03]|nr:BatD family protein [Odoribacter sp. OttesenSCG-928-J03]